MMRGCRVCGAWIRPLGCARGLRAQSSLDSAIRKPAANDFARLRELCGLLETVGFNRQASGKFAPLFAEAGYRTLLLPSTSPAHAAMSFEQKLALWYELGGILMDETLIVAYP